MAFADIMEELKDIKLVELNLGQNVETIKITELNKLQKEILKLFDINKKAHGKEFVAINRKKYNVISLIISYLIK